MNIGAIASRVRKATADNAPTILTALGVTGAVTTAVLAAKGGIKAAEIVREEEARRSDENRTWHVDTRGWVNLTWKCFVPAVGTGAITVVSIVMANHVSTTRAAAMASAYSVSQELFREYKDKVVEKVGEEKHKEIVDDLAQDRIRRDPPPAKDVYVLGAEQYWCKDAYSGRYFKSTLESIKKAENNTNYQIIRNDYASLSDFWDELGLEKTSDSDEIGWNTDCGLEIEYGSAIAEDGTPCITVEFRTIPIRGYYSAFGH